MIESFNRISRLLTPPLKDVYDRHKVWRGFTKNSNGATTASFRVYSSEHREFWSRNSG